MFALRGKPIAEFHSSGKIEQSLTGERREIITDGVVMVYHVEVKDILNKSAWIRIEQNYKGLDPIWKSLTVGRFRVPIGLCQNYDDGLLLLYDDTVRYGYIKYGQFKVVLLRDFWAVERLKINDLGNAFIYDEGVTHFEGGIGMWSKLA